MYEETEVDISWKYLGEVIAAIDEPVVVLGGWAVRFLVNERYKENTGREYLGSRDIDLGFQVGDSDLGNTAFAKALTKLEKDLHFRHVSFRLLKEFHSETGEELDPEKSKDLPPYLIFPMYVDMIVDRITPEFKNRFQFTPIDEPILGQIFADMANHIERTEFGKSIWLPTTELMLVMKIRSFPDRDKEHKKVKDLCDICSLLLFGSLPDGVDWLGKVTQQKDVERFRKTLAPSDIERASEILAIDLTIIDAALNKYKLK